MEAWVFFQIGVVLAVAASGRFRWMTAGALVLLALGTMPLWIVFFQIISAGAGLVLYRELNSEWGKYTRWRCHQCLDSAWYPALSEITECTCGRTEGRRENCWYFRCSCGHVNLLEGAGLPPQNRTVRCGRCNRVTDIKPRKGSALSISDPSLNWRLEAAHSNGTIWLLNPRLRKVHSEIRRFNRGQEQSAFINLAAKKNHKKYGLVLLGGLAVVVPLGLKISGVFNPDSPHIVKGWKIESNANLQRAILADADLRQADLRGANLSGADLSGAIMFGADLTGANLHGADLSRADLAGADLTGANLTKANLRQTFLRGANLTNAKLLGSNMTKADLALANLRGAKPKSAYLTRAYLNLPTAYEINQEYQTGVRPPPSSSSKLGQIPSSSTDQSGERSDSYSPSQSGHTVPNNTTNSSSGGTLKNIPSNPSGRYSDNDDNAPEFEDLNPDCLGECSWDQ